ncbi:hypothetical protein [Pseudonocardia spirodelae]|uniref:Polysaccharide chain length determinant N-terminal domain-containing protein n=1 Tax=Pseudonocardia spirodelae TaxID=3133431 RepID=A0ABU8T3Y9_9PSEU
MTENDTTLVPPGRNGSHPLTGSAPPADAATRGPDARRLQLWGLLALVLVILGAGTGFLASLLVTPQFAARSDLLYVITREQPTGFLREDRNLTTQTVMLQSRTVVEPVAVAAGLTPEELAARTTVTLVPESEVISVEVRDPSPDRALQLVQALTARYLQVSSDRARGGVQNYLDGELRGVLARLDAIPAADSRERAPLVDREQELRGRLDDLAVTDIAGPAASVLVPAWVEPDPVAPDRAWAVGTGAASGLLVALVLVAVLARRGASRR